MRLLNKGPVEGMMAVYEGKRVIVCQLTPSWIPDLRERGIRETLISTAPLGAAPPPSIDAGQVEWVKWWQGAQAAPTPHTKPHVIIEAKRENGKVVETEVTIVKEGDGPGDEDTSEFTADVLTLLEGRKVAPGAVVLVTAGSDKCVVTGGKDGTIGPYLGKAKATSGIKMNKKTWLALVAPDADVDAIITTGVVDGSIKLSGKWATELKPLTDAGDDGDDAEGGEE